MFVQENPPNLLTINLSHENINYLSSALLYDYTLIHDLFTLKDTKPIKMSLVFFFLYNDVSLHIQC